VEICGQSKPTLDFPYLPFLLPARLNLIPSLFEEDREKLFVRIDINSDFLTIKLCVFRRHP